MSETLSEFNTLDPSITPYGVIGAFAVNLSFGTSNMGTDISSS